MPNTQPQQAPSKHIYAIAECGSGDIVFDNLTEKMARLSLADLGHRHKRTAYYCIPALPQVNQ